MTVLAPDRADAASPAAPRPSTRRFRPSVLVLLAATAVLYLWNLTASGWGNSFYAAATQAGSQSWTAWLFGALDPGGVITVDKPPAALWVSGLFARVFGFSSWTVLAPQALEGVAAVGLLYATVKRTSGHVAGLLAGAALAITPVAVLMFRFNLPDALLVLLLVAAAYCTVRAVEKASPAWLMLAGAAVGFGFLTKMLQAFLVLPALAVAYLVAAPTGLGRRIAHLAAATGALLVSAGWFVVLVALWPAGSRPYIGGSTDNSELQLALGYNGLGRIFGGDGNPGGGGPGGLGGTNTAFGGSSGLFRMFGPSFGTEISWLLPAALIALVAGLWFTRRAPRTDRTRAALLLWGGWLAVTALVFSFMSGITHPYYSVALAPPIAALVAIGGRELWRGRSSAAARGFLGAMIAVTGVWSFILLHRTASWLPALRWLVLAASILVATAVILGVRRLVAGLAVLTVAAASGAYGLATAATTHAGSIPISGPVSESDFRGPGVEESNVELANLLAATTTKWAAATGGAMSAASLQLASGKGVIAIGGWNGGDPAPTLEQFQKYIEDGQISYYVAGGGMRGGGGPGGNSDIAEWVAANFESTTVGGTAVYDLRSGSHM